VQEIDEATFRRKYMARAVWTHGTGEFATLAHCGGELTIMHHETLEAAAAALRDIDSCGCCGRCTNHHTLVRVRR
jgi:hypothetical protein